MLRTVLKLVLALYTVGVTVAVNATELATLEVQKQSFARYETFDAVIEAINASTVSSRIAAEVVEINYDVDDIVPQGAVIMRFRDEEFQARVAQIEAALQADKAQSREAVARQKEVAAEAKRFEDLFKRRQVTQSAVDKARADLNAANARLQAISAQIKARQAQLEEAMVQLSYTTIKAPYQGIVTERLIELGEMASPGQHLMSGLSLSHLRAIAAVPQYLLPAIKLASSPQLLLEDGRQFNGSEMTVIPLADASHSFKVRVTLPENIDALYPGSFAKLRFTVGEQQLIAIPVSAMVQRSEVSGVYVLSGSNIVFRQVRPGRHLEHNMREILAGLNVGEQVAVNPLQAVKQLKQVNR